MGEEANSSCREGNLKTTCCTSEQLSLNVPIGCKITVVSFTSKPCINSHYITKDSLGLALCLHGCIFTEIVYLIEKECRKQTQVFLTPFCKCISIPDCKTKILSASVSLENRSVKRVSECTLLVFYTLSFLVKVAVAICNDEKPHCDDFKGFQCNNTINFENAGECDPCKSSDIGDFEDVFSLNKNTGSNYSISSSSKNNNGGTKYDINGGNFIDYNNQSTQIRNDWMKFLTSFQQQNRI